MPKLSRKDALKTDRLGADQTFDYEERILYVTGAPDDVLDDHAAYGPEYTMVKKTTPEGDNRQARDVSDWT